MNAIAVFIGGGLGSLCRFGISKLLALLSITSLPYATLASNVLSSVLLAFAISKLGSTPGSWWFSLVAIGFCGGFSTFSTFSYETFELIKTGNLPWAIVNVLISVCLCIFVIYLASKSIA